MTLVAELVVRWVVDCYEFLGMDVVVYYRAGDFVNGLRSDGGASAMNPETAHDQANSDPGRNHGRSQNRTDPAGNSANHRDRQEDQPKD